MRDMILVRARNEVGLILDEHLSKEVIEIYRKNDRLIRVKLLCGKEVVIVISAYEPQVGLSTEEKRQFWGILMRWYMVSHPHRE